MTVGYYNSLSFTQVILADKRDPNVSWANHRARGSLGGVDLVAAVGTPIYAPADCVIVNSPNFGSGGNTVTLQFSDGWRDQFMHLSRFTTAGAKKRGELVGWSGRSVAPGYNPIDPHIHWHRIDPTGVRRNPFNYFQGSSGAGIVWLISIDVQKKFQQYLTNLKLYSGQIDGMWGEMSWKAIQGFLATQSDADGKLYTGVVDGDPGPLTIKGLQRLARRGGYTGPIDGEIGAKGSAALGTWLDSVLVSTPAPGEYGVPIPANVQKLMQQLLTDLKLYDGLIDGDWGSLSWKAIQRLMTDEKVYDGAVDGDPGDKSYDGLQKLAAKGGYTGPIDHEIGENSIAGLNTYINNRLNESEPVEPAPPQTPSIPAVPSGYMFGIDIGSTQAGIDLAKFKTAGGCFVGIKMGGGNASDSPYVAPHYETQLAMARLIELPVIHYWFNGQKLDVAAQAKFFVEKSHVREGDIVAIDVEAETDTGTRAWNPAEVMVFIKGVQKMYPGMKFLIYMSATVERGNDWKEVRDDGHELWVAAYNRNDGSIGTPPILEVWTEYMMWQYSSVVMVPGWGAGLDANLAKVDMFTKMGWKKPVEPPKPVDRFDEFLLELGKLVNAYR